MTPTRLAVALRPALATVAALVPSLAAPALAGPPVSADGPLVVELVAQEPRLVTPTGVACDVRGNVWVIESNTHFPPKGYKGHPTDRVWVFRGAGNDPAAAADVSAADQVMFADGFQQAMSLTVTPAGRVYVVCRNEVVLLEDKDHDLKPDPLPPAGGPSTAPATTGPARPDRRTLVRLDTKAVYPHNGLNGVALSPDGASLTFCLGMNAGYDYVLTGTDGSRAGGGGEGGSIWRCTPDGGKLERVASGFWNCHDLTFDAFGRLFAVDNDPDDIGPCRLLDILDGGDYGWKFKNGRRGVHPFTSWNGELPGTLPMVAATGEAPSGVLAYESDDLPPEYRGQLLVTSWGDHVIQRYELKEKGASFESKPVEWVRGGEDFRPVGIAQAADGSVFVTDWVDKSYTLHGKGKLWRIRAKEPTASGPRLRADDVAKRSPAEWPVLLAHPKREVRVAAGDALASAGPAGAEPLRHAAETGDTRRRLQALWALSATAPTDPAVPLAAGAGGAGDPTVHAEVLRMVGRHGGAGPAGVVAYLHDHLPPQLISRRATATGYGAVPASWPYPLPAGRNEPFVLSAAASATARNDAFRQTVAAGEVFQPRDLAGSPNADALVAAIALRRCGLDAATKQLPALLAAADPMIRRLALQWVGEDRLTQFAANIPDVLKAGPVSRDLLAAYLACQEKLAAPAPEPGKVPAERAGGQFAAAFLFDDRNDLALRKVALELIDPADPKLPADKLVALVGPMGADAVKAVAWRTDPASQAALRTVAADVKQDPVSRREAVLGLARSAAAADDARQALRALLFPAPGDDPVAAVPVPPPPALRLDALRALRGALDAADAKRLADLIVAAAAKGVAGPGGEGLDAREWAAQVVLAFKPTPDALSAADRARLAPFLPARPTDTAGWQRWAAAGGDPDAGRRVFALAAGAKCYVCHTSENRGGQVGPDLTRVGSAMDRAKIVESILEPSKEVAPLFVSTVFELKDGETVSGVTLPEAGASFVSIADATGAKRRFKAEDIVSRRPEKLSLMPEGLVEAMTATEFRDLVAYLAVPK